MAEREVQLPALSPTMERGDLLEWLVAVGDEVTEGQSLASVETDKVDTGVESPYDGTVVELLVDEGTSVEVGQAIVRIETASEGVLGDLDLGDGDAEEPLEGVEPDAEGAQPAGGSPEDAGADEGAIIPAPPPIRSRAKRLGVDLSQVERTGSRGQVTNADLDRYLVTHGIDAERPSDEQLRPPERPAEPVAAPQRAEAPPRPAPEAAPRRPAASTRDRVRRATARAMTVSAAIPQFTLHRWFDLARAAERKAGRSWTTEIVRASARALREHPQLNATWDADAERSVPQDEVRIGLAVDTPRGLLVVGVSDPDRVSAAQADHAVRDAVQRTLDDRLDARDVAGVSFTVSNLGGLGIDSFRALVVPPQAAILSVGRVVERPVVVDGRVRPRLGVDLGLSCDHRVVDGADGARFLATLATHLED